MSNIANPTLVPSFSLGGRTIPVGAELIILGAVNDATHRYSCLRRTNTAAGYTPSGTKKFKAIAVITRALATQSAGAGTLLYADDDLGIYQNTAPTNPVYCFGSATPSCIYTSQTNQDYIAIDWEIPNGKYGYVDNAVAINNTLVYGYEV